ncbi:hypothetical protein HZ326_14539 [Fusarium oxysporum f. sp. albedinis]|nr:hypothetical protein HZ326_14539 [Fusarium oxysporum f. sp. albedinis]
MGPGIPERREGRVLQHYPCMEKKRLKCRQCVILRQVILEKGERLFMIPRRQSISRQTKVFVIPGRQRTVHGPQEAKYFS